jgi:hypothetical protein
MQAPQKAFFLGVSNRTLEPVPGRDRAPADATRDGPAPFAVSAVTFIGVAVGAVSVDKFYGHQFNQP